MRYADSEVVLEKSHNSASESEATVLSTPDSVVFIKISRTPRSVVPLDKGASAIRIVRHCEIIVIAIVTWHHESLQRKVFTSVPLPARQSMKYVAWICRRVVSWRGAVSDQVLRIYLYLLRQMLGRKNFSYTALRDI